MISRAFIPPWSLVITKPETLGPDTSRKEAGTLVSRYNFTGKQFCTSHSEIQQKIIKIFFRFAPPDLSPRYFISIFFSSPALPRDSGPLHWRWITNSHCDFLRATTTPSRVGFMKASNSGSPKINRLCSRMASVHPGTIST
ncbi:MAG: hypothetical protein K0S36_336 [Nitrosospira multiformis]|nr:hypothetical protein [Nitrosospira multiformis]